MQRQNNLPCSPKDTSGQQQQIQRFINQEQQFQEYHHVSEQQRISRTEHHVTHQITAQPRGEHHQPLYHIYEQSYFSPPVFEQIFKNVRFAHGGDALFEGKIKGIPKPIVSWSRNGAPLIESDKYQTTYNEVTGELSLLIKHIENGDEGEYTCTAGNQYGEAICSVFIQPEGQTMPKLQSEQKYNKMCTNGYELTSVQEKFRVDTFEYRLLREVSYRQSITCRSSYDTDYKLPTEIDRVLGPVSPPQIIQKPRNSKLIEGSDAIFSAKVISNPKPRLTWFHNGQRIVQSQKYEIIFSNNSAMLRIKNAVIEDGGYYTLLIENTQGCVVSSAVLAVEPAQETLEPRVVDITDEQLEQGKALSPKFTKVFYDHEVTEGKMTRFDCRVTGRPYPEVSWYINEQQVHDDSTHKILVNETGSHSLMITNAGKHDSGTISCVAKNKAGEMAINAQLTVIEKEQVIAPKFVQRFTTVNVKENEPVIMSARAIGTPVPRITWQKDGVQISSTSERYIGIEEGATALEIPRAKASDAGWYQCTAQNIAGSTATRARLYVEIPKKEFHEQKRLQFPRPTKIIKPEPAPEPEIIYLRHIQRSKPRLHPDEEERIYPPPQFIIPLQNVDQHEGGKVHFEARIEPVGDPSMVVEWLFNGRPLAASSRITSVFKFGFIALDILSIILEDSGKYLCRVTNDAGVTESCAFLSVKQKSSIEKSSQHPESLPCIQKLEDSLKYECQYYVEELINQKPAFIKPLQNFDELEEGKNVHFEAQLIPVSDPSMRVEWFKDGQPITASSRITAIFNFGYVSLNIMHLRVEDAGSYTVRAVNRLGEAVSVSTIKIKSKKTVTADSGIQEQQRYMEKIEELEEYKRRQNKKYVEEIPESVVLPEFKTPIFDQLDVKENGYAHFETCLEPIGDSTLRVEWLKNGCPLEASARITTFFNFGYVALTIKQVSIHDVGTYTCRAYNAVGEDTTSAKLTVLSKKCITFDSQHPKGLEKFQYIEDSSKYIRLQENEVKVSQKPRFLGPLKGTNKILEGQRAHFEARVEPQSDLSMKIEWYHNGKPIMPATRIQTYNDFGYVAIDISTVRAEDAGVYTVIARNNLGEVKLSGSMTVETRSSIDTSSMHIGTYEKTQFLEGFKELEQMHYDIQDTSKSQPVFVQQLSEPKPIHEGKNIHLECRLEPMGDPTMRVEWFHNGYPITIGSRFRTYYDFGFVALDIIKTTALDSGEYTVRATNQLGSTHSSSCVRIITRSDIITETQNEMSLEQIQMLEDSSRGLQNVSEEITTMQAPQFTRPLHNIETIEDTNIHLECRLQPVGDPTMKVEWFVNGQPIKTGHRFRPAYEFDYVALDLLGVYAIDSGVYTCQARNQLGEAVTSCSVHIIARKDLVLETQHPSGLEKIQYLEDSSRFKKAEYIDEVVNIKPRFVTQPKSLINMCEGQHAHFECKIEPVTDPALKIEWFKNGNPITVGHRFRPIHDFGYVALDIIDLIAEDSGIYTCKAINAVGTDETTCKLVCRKSEQIITLTQNEAGLEQIYYLEDKSKYHMHEEVEETTKQAPVFTTSLKNIEIKEGQRAHFECRLIPVSDPTMKVEWYHNKIPLKSGSRFTETNNFGFTALDIMSCLAEDSGTYTCRAVNALGEAITSAVAIIHTKASVYLESQHEGALTHLHLLEDSKKYERQNVVEDVITQAPVFTVPVKDINVAENEAAHFEARLIPVGDSKLNVEWLKNGVPIQASNRITTMHDFGYVALNMKYVNPEDSGTYTCRATNELGQAVTSASLIVQCRAALQLESQNESALQKIHCLEDTSKYQHEEEEEIIITQAPIFVTQLIGPTSLIEAQSAHYECRIEPYSDPQLKIEWFYNGKPLTTGHRFRTTYDFGFAALDILTVYGEDSGEYTCRATNRKGTTQSSISLIVKSKSSVIQDTLHEEALEKLQYFEDSSRYRRKKEDEQQITERPQFGKPLRNVNTEEGNPVHLEATLVPINDPTMQVEWFCNGYPIQQGHRFKTTYDFGFVALDISHANAEDKGTYMCKAKNSTGEAVTTCAVNVTAKAGLYLETLDEQRLQKIKQLENCQKPKTLETEFQGRKPVFRTALTSLENLKEGDHAHLECRVEPINDPNLIIEWFVNGKRLRVGHRFRTTHDFGYVALDILYVYGEDTGSYVCKATNLLGEATNTCNLHVVNRHSIIVDTQHPDGLKKIQKLESKVTSFRSEIQDLPISPPSFTTKLRGTTEIYEGQTVHFEAQVQPIHDPNLRIEFYHNDKPLSSASRFHITFDFGYVALDIDHSVTEDEGEYSVHAINSLGQCTSSITLKVHAKSSVVTESLHPDGFDKIKQLEQSQPLKRPEISEPITRQRPVFTQPLQNIDHIIEGQDARFECRVIPVGDPNLKVEWYRNDRIIEDSSRISKQHDFGFVSMNISHVREEDEGVYMCRAINPLGEAVTTASMTILTKAGIQLDTQHPEGVRKIQELERAVVSKPKEPERVFEKPIFTQLLIGQSELWEGQNAHFEARVVPVGDSTMRFEWYVNGVELKMGSRFHTTHDFGFVTLNINSVVKEDSGVYMCKAISRAGEAVSSTAMKIKSKSPISDDPLLPEAWEKIQKQEAAMIRVPEMFVDAIPLQAPIFTAHLQSYDNLQESQHILLDAQVEPKTDPNLRIEWFKNGISLTTGARIRSTFDFGLVTLSINGLRSDDSGIYTCRATNLFGEAVSTSNLRIENKYWLMSETLHPDSLIHIDALERPKTSHTETEEHIFESPVFITHLNNVECKEGDNVHLECNIEPSKDPTMKIEWFVNGKQLEAAAKSKATYDFGYCALDLTHSYTEDSGIYTCKATNSKGSATTSGTLKCSPGKTMFLETQHPQGAAGLEAVQETEETSTDKYKCKEVKSEQEYPAPIWINPIQKEFHLSETQTLHLQGQVEPKNDPNLKIEWYFNGKILQHGSRFKMSSEFGFVTLDLIEAYERDQGIYTCKAYNISGEAFTSTTVYCVGKDVIVAKTQHPKGAQGLEKIQNLEESLQKSDKEFKRVEDEQPPTFITQFNPIRGIAEKEVAHFEATLSPIGDQSMIIEWFYNGRTLEASHRIRTIYSFGFVALEILGTKVDDSGVYTCRATNKWGQTESSVQLECVDKAVGQKPKFTTHIQNIEGLKDGQSAHFECTLTPINDPDLKVEWYHNGKPLRHSTRIKPVSDFGFILLDIAYVQSHDSGEYACRAYNKFGEDFTRASLICHGKSGVYLDSLQPDSLPKIRELESSYSIQLPQPRTPVEESPKFITQINDITKLVEGQSAHFEARLIPVTDPDLRVEWYHNGMKLPHGHRYRTFHDFGIVILDILYCYEENSGVYECRAINKFGEDSTKATLNCKSRENLILDSQLPRGMEGGLEKIQTLEDSLNRTHAKQEDEVKGRAPIFTVPLKNMDSLREGENVHIEARLVPTDDDNLKVEWFWNGKPLQAGSRFRTFCDFGFVILEISPVYPEDSGEYSCRAINEYGEAVTTSIMKVQGKRSIILESQLPKGMENTIERIAELEGLGVARGPTLPEDDFGKPPEFVTTPSDLILSENSLAHFECRIQPVNDPSMRVEWFHNGKALWAGSRTKTINDFGFVILEIAECFQRDAGLYSCKATNKHGEATVSCKLQVKGRQSIVIEPQLPSNFRTGTKSLQKLEENLHKREEVHVDEETPNPPKFVEGIKDNIDIQEGDAIHFDCRVEPVGDPTMKIEWLHNGKALATGSRVHMLNDFGFIALDIDYIYGRDSGEYICKATNKWGFATTMAKVTCKAKGGIIFDSQLPNGISAEKLKNLEKGYIREMKKVEETDFGSPRFITEIVSCTVEESEAVRFECRVEPKEDPNLYIEWYRNGKLLPTGHRYRTVYDMGFVSLDILYVYADDTGEYICRAINRYGEATTRATISCKQLPSIILQNQLPKGMKQYEALTQMEATIKKYTSEIHLTEDDLFDPEKKQPPRFVTQIKDQLNLTEMQKTKFECQLSPVGDPNMNVEWFFNSKPLHHKNRFTPIYDFGYVAMNFDWVYPEDSGEYVCRATNLYGKDETKAFIKTTGKPGIIYESQLPKHMKTIERIREMEASWQVAPEESDDELKPKTAPSFVSKPEPQTVEEGYCARFCCRVTGHPRPRVMWLINGHAIVHGSRYKLTNDGMYHLDIQKTRQYDTGKVEVIARNSVGEAIACTELIVVPRTDDFRSVLKNSPRPWYDSDMIQYQKQLTETELEKKFEDRKQYLAEQGGVDLKTVEHLKPKMLKAPETEWQRLVKLKKTENYYSKIQEIDNEQILRETKLREESHQNNILGQKDVSSSVAKGVSQNYEENLQIIGGKTVSRSLEETHRLSTDPSASYVHGKEVYSSKQKQTQKETIGDTEITRRITATETTEVEHIGATQERLVEGPVKLCKSPFFIKKIKPCRVFEGEQAKFEVEFDGNPLPRVKWYRENFLIQNSSDFQIHTFGTKSVLIIRQVFLEDSAVFAVIAENLGGTAKCSANLVVEEKRRQGKVGPCPPSFIQTIQDTTVSLGQLARFDARVTGTKPIDVYWLKDGKKITSSIKHKTVEEDNTYTLLIIEICQEDVGKYECVAVNGAGEAICDAQCLIQSSTKPMQEKPLACDTEKVPTLIEPLKNHNVKEGSPVIFKCRCIGKPNPTAQWFKGENIIKQSRYFQMNREGEYYNLRISEAFPEDEGIYKCVLSNKGGNTQTQATLKVLVPETQEPLPTITALKDVTVIEGMPAQFKTIVTGKTKATSVQWFREGVLIPESPDFKMIFDGKSAVLLIGTTYEEDSGVFTCRVTSFTGQVESSAKLTVKMRRFSTYQFNYIHFVEDEETLSSKEEGRSSKAQLGRQSTPNREILKLEHLARSRDKRKVRSKSLQPHYSIPWRRHGHSRRGRSLDKQPFYPGFKPAPVPIWTSEEIKLKPTIIEKKEIPKAEIQIIFLKSIQQERNQAMRYISDQIDKIILKNSDKEIIPWVQMRERLKAVQKVQKQVDKFELEQVHLRPTREEDSRSSELLYLKSGQDEKLTTMETERIKNVEEISILEITQQIDKLITTQKIKNEIPWKEMRKCLNTVEKTQKKIEEFKLEDIYLKPANYKVSKTVPNITIKNVENNINVINNSNANEKRFNITDTPVQIGTKENQHSELAHTQDQKIPYLNDEDLSQTYGVDDNLYTNDSKISKHINSENQEVVKDVKEIQTERQISELVSVDKDTRGLVLLRKSEQQDIPRKPLKRRLPNSSHARNLRKCNTPIISQIESKQKQKGQLVIEKDQIIKRKNKSTQLFQEDERGGPDKVPWQCSKDRVVELTQFETAKDENTQYAHDEKSYFNVKSPNDNDVDEENGGELLLLTNQKYINEILKQPTQQKSHESNHRPKDVPLVPIQELHSYKNKEADISLLNKLETTSKDKLEENFFTVIEDVAGEIIENTGVNIEPRKIFSNKMQRVPKPTQKVAEKTDNDHESVVESPLPATSKTEITRKLDENTPYVIKIESVPVAESRNVDDVFQNDIEEDIPSNNITAKQKVLRKQQMEPITSKEPFKAQVRGRDGIETMNSEVSNKTVILKRRDGIKQVNVIKTIGEKEHMLTRKIDVKSQLNVLRNERKHVYDDSQPFPELELISQKQVKENVDKISYEGVVKDSVFQEICNTNLIQQRKIRKQKWKIKAPKFVGKLECQKCRPGQSTVLECLVEGIPIPEIKWYFNDSELFPSEKHIITVNDNIVQLQISNTTQSDIGTYTCQVRNEAGVATSRRNISFDDVPDTDVIIPPADKEPILEKTFSKIEARNIEFAPKITKTLPEKVIPIEGTLTKLEVKVVGEPKPTIKWLRDDEEVFASEEYQIDNFEDGTSVLVINNLYSDDSGRITFEAHNHLGVDETTAVLSVGEIVGTKDYRKPEWVTHMEEMQEALKAAKCSPSFIREINDCRRAEGETIKFDCQFSGNPKPDVLWYHDNILLKESERIKIVTENDKSVCEIRSARDEDVGYYMCKAINEIGINISRAKFDLTFSPLNYTKKLKKIHQGKSKLKKSSFRKPQAKIETSQKQMLQAIIKIAPVQKEIIQINSTQKTNQPSILFTTKASSISDKWNEEVDKQVLVSDIKIDGLDESDAIKEAIVEIKNKLFSNKISSEDIVIISKYNEVNKVLQTVETETLRAAEAPLRALATIGVMIRYGLTLNDVVKMYGHNVFPSLQSPETQSALVQLIEREGNDELVTQVLTEESALDERILAATVGFRSLVRMMEMYKVTIEDIITKFVRKDFITQEWKFATKRAIETRQIVDSNEAVNRIKIEKVFLEERTIVSEGPQLNI